MDVNHSNPKQCSEGDEQSQKPPQAAGGVCTEKDADVLSDFRRNKLEKDSKKNWDLFYKRNSTHFFKDRHWIPREFPELVREISEAEQRRVVLLEAGCGVGNTVFPLLEENPNLFVYACDFSPRAIEFLKAHSAYSDSSCNAFVCDLTRDRLTDSVDCVDIATMIFVLSAITPEKMVQALKNVYSVLRPGGLLLFRDYGLHDHAMLRFGRGHKISENFYTRQDGTRAYYFSEEKLRELVSEAGFEVVENSYVHRETVNRKEGLSVTRVFVQGKFVKPRAPALPTESADRSSPEVATAGRGSPQNDGMYDTTVDCTDS